ATQSLALKYPERIKEANAVILDKTPQSDVDSRFTVKLSGKCANEKVFHGSIQLGMEAVCTNGFQAVTTELIKEGYSTTLPMLSQYDFVELSVLIMSDITDAKAYQDCKVLISYAGESFEFAYASGSILRKNFSFKIPGFVSNASTERTDLFLKGVYKKP